MKSELHPNEASYNLRPPEANTFLLAAIPRPTGCSILRPSGLALCFISSCRCCRSFQFPDSLREEVISGQTGLCLRVRITWRRPGESLIPPSRRVRPSTNMNRKPGGPPRLSESHLRAAGTTQSITMARPPERRWYADRNRCRSHRAKMAG